MTIAPFVLTAGEFKMEDGFTSLVSGSTLDGWRSVGGSGEFRNEDGVIVGTGKNIGANTFLITEKTYKDFDFRFSFKFDDLTGNSGMMFRGLLRDDGNTVYSYQCEHDNGKARSWNAGLFDEKRRGWLVPDRENKEQSEAFTKQGNELMKWDDWNEVRILCEGNHIRIYLNGELRVDFKDTDEENATFEGFFGLQVHSGKSCNVRWKNLRIKEL